MATSGDTTYLLTTTDIIQKAYESLEVYAPGEDVSGEDYASALVSLNMMIKHWQVAKKLYLHQVDEITVFLAANQREYRIGSGSTDHIAVNTNLVETQLTEDEVSTDTLMHVTSTSGMLAGDVIGVVMDDSTILWSTIDTVNSSTTVTLDDALTEDATDGNYVFSYRAASGRILEIEQAVLRQSGGTDEELRQIVYETPMMAMDMGEYFRFPHKGSTGTPLQYYLEKKNTYSTLKLLQVPSTPNYRIKALVKRIVENFTNSTDNPDVPQEYGAPLVFGLAAWLAPQCNRMEKLQYFEAKADQLLEEASSTSQENNVSLIVRPKNG